MVRILYFLVGLFLLSGQSLFSQVFSVQVTENRADWDTIDVNDEKWVDNSSTVSSFNGQDSLVENFIYLIDNNTQTFSEHNLYHFNEKNKDTLHNRFLYVNNQWLDFSKQEYSYITINGQDYVFQLTEYITNNSELLPAQKKIYTYTNKGLLDSIYFYSYNNGFQLVTITKYQYNAFDKIASIVENNNYGEEFLPTKKISYIYNENNLLSIETDSAYISDTWSPINKTLYDYNNDNKMKSYTVQTFFENDTYKNYEKFLFTYYDNGLKFTEDQYLVSGDNNNIFIPSTEFQFIYNKQGKKDTTYYYVWDGNKFAYVTKYYIVSTLDDKENLINNSKPIELFPNPSNDFLNIKTIKFDKAQIIDINGKIVKDNILSNSSINLNGLTSGTYFLRTFNSNKSTNTQFIIER